MARELSTDFKTAFGRMLVGLKMNYSIPNAMNYSQTLYEYTMGGLTVMDKIGRYSKYERAKDYDADFRIAERYYKEALACLRIRGRDYIVQERILSCCFEINKLIFPIALTEGVLVMNEEMMGVLDMFMKPGAMEETPRRYHR